MPAFKKVSKVQVTKCTPEVIAKITNNLRLGSYIETAVVMADVSKDVFYDWIKLSHKKPNSIYATLRHAVEKAQEEATTRDLLNIDKCAMGQEWEYERYQQDVFNDQGDIVHHKGDLVLKASGNPIPKKIGSAPDWSASAWRLERRRPKEWSRTEKIEHTGRNGGPIESAHETPEEKEQRKGYIEKLKLKLPSLDG